MKNTLIIHFPASTRPSLDRVIEIETALTQAFAQSGAAIVDGNDFGATANIFIFPRKSWEDSITIVLAYLERKQALSEVLVIKRLRSGTYQVVWPRDFVGTFEM